MSSLLGDELAHAVRTSTSAMGRKSCFINSVSSLRIDLRMPSKQPRAPVQGGGSTPEAAGGSGGCENRELPHQILTCHRLGWQAFGSTTLWMRCEPFVDGRQHQQGQDGRCDQTADNHRCKGSLDL